MSYSFNIEFDRSKHPKSAGKRSGPLPEIEEITDPKETLREIVEQDSEELESVIRADLRKGRYFDGEVLATASRDKQGRLVYFISE